MARGDLERAPGACVLRSPQSHRGKGRPLFYKKPAAAHRRAAATTSPIQPRGLRSMQNGPEIEPVLNPERGDK